MLYVNCAEFYLIRRTIVGKFAVGEIHIVICACPENYSKCLFAAVHNLFAFRIRSSRCSSIFGSVINMIQS